MPGPISCSIGTLARRLPDAVAGTAPGRVRLLIQQIENRETATPVRFTRNPALARPSLPVAPVQRQLLKIAQAAQQDAAVKRSERHPLALPLARERAEHDKMQDAAPARSRDLVNAAVALRTCELHPSALLKTRELSLPSGPDLLLDLMKPAAAPPQADLPGVDTDGWGDDFDDAPALSAEELNDALRTFDREEHEIAAAEKAWQETQRAPVLKEAPARLMQEILAMKGTAGLRQAKEAREMAVADKAWEQMRGPEGVADGPVAADGLTQILTSAMKSMSDVHDLEFSADPTAQDSGVEDMEWED